MSNYRRLKIPGALYFFTVVTYRRHSLLTEEPARSILKEVLIRIQIERPFDMPALCLLPNHLHCIWQMPQGDCDFSTRWAMIKRLFSKDYIAAGKTGLPQTESRRQRRELGIWQRRFWEHRIRDQEDYWNHVNYIHHNPLKHGLVERISDWPYSTYHRFCEQGFYKNFDWSSYKTDNETEQMEFIE